MALLLGLAVAIVAPPLVGLAGVVVILGGLIVAESIRCAGTRRGVRGA